MRWGLAGAAALLLSGCVSFLPTYDEAVYGKLDAAVTDLEKIRAAVAVPYQPAPAFKDVEPFYLSALGNLIAAEKTASLRAAGIVRRQPASEAAAIVASAIGDCRAAVEEIARRHQAGETVNGFIFDQSLVVRNCQIPVMMEKRLKR